MEKLLLKSTRTPGASWISAGFWGMDARCNVYAPAAQRELKWILARQSDKDYIQAYCIQRRALVEKFLALYEAEVVPFFLICAARNLRRCERLQRAGGEPWPQRARSWADLISAICTTESPRRRRR